MIADEALEKAIEFIKANFDIDQLYTAKQLLQYARSNFTLDELADKSEILEWVRDNCEASELYPNAITNNT